MEADNEVYQSWLAAKDAQPLDHAIFRSKEDIQKPIIHLLVANLISGDGIRNQEERIAHNFGKEEEVDRYFDMFGKAGRQAVIHMVTLDDYRSVIDTIPKGEDIINFCDGTDVDGAPGPSVIKYLEEKKIPHYGCDLTFFMNTSSKTQMKKLFVDNNVSTAKFFALNKGDKFERESFKHMTYPLFVKVDDSYDSIGLSRKSVCHNYEELVEQIQFMFETFDHLLVEEFILGSEFTVMVIGDSSGPSSPIEVYTAERDFYPQIPPEERFCISNADWRDRGTRYKLQPLQKGKDDDILKDLVRRAYVAIGGNAYARADVRRRNATNEFFILELNAMCCLSHANSILKMDGKEVSHLIYKVLQRPLTL
eukprot:TRINITY_DN4322_c0_g1_i3.p1 TRINITY_DN4322_c0_g1~~TRINITY_DN4322_c0_g1_i3.p1  ORF type:complete len:395 (+),score=90.82 TRINITY_DN4322_c0_g1_i3:91-1185(+)